MVKVPSFTIGEKAASTVVRRSSVDVVFKGVPVLPVLGLGAGTIPGFKIWASLVLPFGFGLMGSGSGSSEQLGKARAHG